MDFSTQLAGELLHSSTAHPQTGFYTHGGRVEEAFHQIFFAVLLLLAFFDSSVD
jgi:hypothetical protein